jgi:hypothetical protein
MPQHTAAERVVQEGSLPWWEPIPKAAQAALFLVCHTALAAVVVTCIWAFAGLFHLLWGANDPLFFDRFPLRYLFDAADLSVVLVFTWFGVISAIRALKD